MPENSILSPVSLTSFFDNATGEARQANLFFYKSGTLDPIVVYTDAALSIPFPQPVATSGWGRVPPVYVGEISPPGYRVRTFDQYQTLIEDLDGLPGALTTATGGSGGTPSGDVDTGDLTPNVQVALAKTGDIKLKWSNHNSEPGWIEITRGGTIGSAASNASLLAHADAHALFLHIWQQDATDNRFTTCPVIPSKGASAQGDWDANKQITVPDARGRMLGGLDQYEAASGKSVTKRLDAGKFDNWPNYTPPSPLLPYVLGASGGESAHKLVVTELAVHQHDWIDYVGHSHLVHDLGHTHGVNDSGHNHGTVTNDGGGTNYNVIGRTDAGDTYSMTSNTDGGFKQVSLSTQTYQTGISIQSTPASTGSHSEWSLTLKNTNYWNSAIPPEGGYQQGTTWIGSYNATDKKWHQPTEYNPRPANYPDATQRGDVPHNTLAPFILFAIFMKL